MYLSRILLKPDRTHGVLRLRVPERHLWRIDRLNDNLYVLVLTQEEPNFTSFCQQFSPSEDAWETKNYDSLLDSLTDGSTWRFRLTANPTVSKSHQGNNGQGKIIACNSMKDQRNWLLRKADKKGFQVNDFNVTQSIWKKFENGIAFLSVTYEGILTVTDVTLFREALQNGIGRGKAYGMGLLTIIR